MNVILNFIDGKNVTKIFDLSSKFKKSGCNCRAECLNNHCKFKKDGKICNKDCHIGENCSNIE